jgi:hypothetical protein
MEALHSILQADQGFLGLYLVTGSDQARANFLPDSPKGALVTHVWAAMEQTVTRMVRISVV